MKYTIKRRGTNAIIILNTTSTLFRHAPGRTEYRYNMIFRNGPDPIHDWSEMETNDWQTAKRFALTGR